MTSRSSQTMTTRVTSTSQPGVVLQPAKRPAQVEPVRDPGMWRSLCGKWVADSFALEQHQNASLRCRSAQMAQNSKKKCGSCGKWVTNEKRAWDQHKATCSPVTPVILHRPKAGEPSKAKAAGEVEANANAQVPAPAEPQGVLPQLSEASSSGVEPALAAATAGANFLMAIGNLVAKR